MPPTVRFLITDQDLRDLAQPRRFGARRPRESLENVGQRQQIVRQCGVVCRTIQVLDEVGQVSVEGRAVDPGQQVDHV